jgi:hypothetical protein
MNGIDRTYATTLDDGFSKYNVLIVFKDRAKFPFAPKYMFEMTCSKQGVAT